jgi:lysozyme
MKTSANGVNLIKRLEGLRLKAYQCSAGVWTVGYGHTGGIKGGDVITQAQADAYLAADLARFEAAVNAAGIPNLNQHQFDAMVSLCYNIGVKAFSGSSLVKRARKSLDASALAGEFLKWVNVGPKYNAGLHARRMKEVQLFNTKC